MNGLYGWDGLDCLDVCAESIHHWTHFHYNQYTWQTWNTAGHYLLVWNVVAVLVVASMDWSSWHGCNDDWSDLFDWHLVCDVCGWTAGQLHRFDGELVGWLANICNYALLRQI